MKSTDQQNPDSPDNRPAKPQRIQLPQRDTVTNLQVSTLLNILVTLSGVILNPTRENDDPNWKDKPHLDGGVLSSAETTFINVCSRLDDVLSDKSRWGFDTQNYLEDRLAKIYDQQLQFVQEQTAVARNMNTPHRQYNPTLLKLVDGTWAAILGDLNNLDNAIMGAGSSPAEALSSFDTMFKGEVPENILNWIADHEAKQKEKQNEQNNSKTVDGTGNKPANGAKGAREKSRRNNKSNGKNPRGDSKQAPGDESPEGGKENAS